MKQARSGFQPTARLARAALVTLLLGLLGLAAAQVFNGTYSAMGRYGLVELVLSQNGSSMKGVLTGNELRFELIGEVDAEDPGYAYGMVEVPEGDQFFEAYSDGQHLELYIIVPLPDGTPDWNNVSLLEFDLAGSTPSPSAPAAATPSPPAPAAPSPAPQVTPAPQAAAGGNPLSAQPAGTNPLASQDLYAGTWSDGQLELELRATGSGYEGWLALRGASYPLRASTGAAALEGTFEAGGVDYPFRATLADGRLILESGGTRYELVALAQIEQREEEPAAPAAPVAPSDETIAFGTYGQLTEDGALAFAEALRFVLAELGDTQALAGISDEQIIDALASGFASLDAESQQALVNARQIWEQAHRSWPYADLATRQEFALAVLTIAYGEQAARSALGVDSGAGGGPVGMPSPDPYMQEQTNNATSCWAAAGCAGYDATEGFTYESPDGY